MAESARKVPVIPALDGFRAYAILVVVALHLLGASGGLDGQRGTGFGVVVWGLAGNVLDVFFILSGFLLFLPVVVRGGLGGLREYASTRGLRLFPAYWLALAISFAIAIPIDALPTPGVAEVAAHATAMQMPARMLDPDLSVGFGANGPLWMISIIVAFYVVLPLVARPYLRHPLAGLAIAAAITTAWKLATPALADTLAAISGSTQGWAMELIVMDQFPGWAFSFALGMTGAWAYVRWRERSPAQLGRPALALLVGAGIAFAACAYAYGRDAASINGAFAGSYARGDELLGLAYSGARAAAMAAILVGPLWLQRPFAIRPARKLAQLSYGLYLIHLPVAIVVGTVVLGLPSDGSPLAVGLWFTVVIAISLVYAALSRRWLERPLIEGSRRRASRRPSASRSRPGRTMLAPSPTPRRAV